MTAVIDYGVGNLFSLCSSLKAIGEDAVVTNDPDALKRAGRVILPGVGAFGKAADALKARGLNETVREIALGGTPLLGICLGMQLLFEKSFEHGEHQGLGLLKGNIVPLAPRAPGLKVPHMGWNDLAPCRSSPFDGALGESTFVYYVHSFYHEMDAQTIALSEYGGAKISGIVGSGNIFGMQFHPEKSGKAGLKLLKSFCERTR